MFRALLIEDNDDHAVIFEDAFIEGFPQAVLVHEGSMAGADGRLSKERFDIVYLDLGLPESRGLETVRRFLELRHPQPVVVITAQGETEIGVEAIKLGAADLLQKASVDASLLTRTTLFALERARVRSELDRKNRMLHTFVAAAGHDLQTPLASIEGLVALLARELEPSLDKSGTALVETLGRSVVDLRALLADMLVFATIGSASVRRHPVALSDLVERILAPLGENERARVRCHSDGTLHCDPGQVHFALKNLVENGLKFWRDEPSSVDLELTAQPGVTIVSVRDDGIGIPEEVVRKIFEPGVRSVDAAEFNGTGFGLAIAREVVEAHGGRIWARPRPGGGSEVAFSLPS